jgi:hypothetical protein
VNIQPLVEGRGEVASLPVLLRRLRDVAGTTGTDGAIRYARSLSPLPILPQVGEGFR